MNGENYRMTAWSFVDGLLFGAGFILAAAAMKALFNWSIC